MELESWSVYRCLYCEVDLDGGTYLLNNSAWYRIDQDYLADVNAAFEAFPISTLQLPDYQDKNEEDYNKRVAASDPKIVLMDRKTVEINSRGLTKIEFCDLYTTNRIMIHVKRYSGSSELSHLFAQGVVPAELLRNEQEFRTKINLLLGASHQLDNPLHPIDPNSFQVVYAIISKSENEVNLPFFSKIMLRHAQRNLTIMGFKVSLAKIRNLN